MSVFSQWCQIAHHHFSSSRSKLRLGQVQEIMAAGMGHNTYASFKLQDLPRLDKAAYALISVEAMARRATDLGATLDAKLCRDAVSNFCMRSTKNEWAREVFVGENMNWAIRRALQNTSHPTGIELSLEINAIFDGITVLTAEPAVPLDRTGNQWRWRVRSTVHASRGQEFFDLQVHADVLFPQIGRRLLSQCVVLGLQRDGEWTEYDPSNEVLDYSYVSDSDL